MIQLFKPLVSQEAIDAAAAVLNSGWIGLGPKTLEFEQQFAKYIGCKYAAAVNSATSALHLACIVSDIKKGDEVITTPITFVSTNHVILYQGATPVFCDVDESTLLIDLDKAEKLVTKRTKAIMVVHYGGNPVAIEKLYAFADRHNLKVIEDAAHACGATYNGRKIGSFGLTCFSFHAVKNLPLGDGGMVTTDDESIYQELIRLRWMGIDKSTFARNKESYQWEYDVTEVGFKYHMNDIAAAMGIEHLKRLDEWNKRRQDMVDLYRRLLSDVSSENINFLNITPGAQSANHLCVIKVKNRDKAVDKLKEAGIGVGVHYKPNHLYKPYAAYSTGVFLPVAEKAYSEIISLPLHLYLTDDDIKFVVQAIKRIL
jgi:Predicted pyridoxal phosphate-dependent enzyme apparently involved in regulation of cell wall biogenesis